MLSRNKPTKPPGQRKPKCSPDTEPDTAPAEATPELIERFGLADIPPGGVVWILPTGAMSLIYAVPHSGLERGLLFVGGRICGNWRGSEALDAATARDMLGTLLKALPNPQRVDLTESKPDCWPWPEAPWEWNCAVSPAGEQRGDS